MNIYYIYAWVRKNGTPYYIGKGKGLRAWQKHEGQFKPTHNRIIIMESGLTELGALALERRYIRWWGRKDIGTGILYNQTDGGDGAAFPGELNNQYGKTGSLSHWYGVKRPRTLQHNERQRVAQRASKKPRYTRTEDHKRLMADSCREAKKDLLGTRWWTNGVTSCQSHTSPGPEWHLGQLNANTRRWLVTDPDGKEYSIISMSAFCRQHNLNKTLMSKVAKGRPASHRGWHCRQI